MSVGFNIEVHDGTVVAVDSASTLTLKNGTAAAGSVALNVDTYANKTASRYSYRHGTRPLRTTGFAIRFFKSSSTSNRNRARS